MTKLLYCIRHGTALHNVNYWKIGRKAYTEYPDTPLIDYGKLEATLLNTSWKQISRVELVLVSPLTRTLETASLVFKDYNIPMIAIDELMEYPQAEEICNLRAEKNVLMERFPKIDFSNLADDPRIYWNDEFIPEKEIELLNDRIEKFKKYVKTRPESTIAIVSHSSFLGQMMFNVIGDENNELKHCFPYKYEIN